MEMERISDDVIKVYINVDDLEERGVNFLDLISDQRSVEKFFYSILEEVDVDKTFYDSEAITFQVIPSSDGIELYISRSNFDDIDNFFEQEVMKRLRDRKAKLKRNNHSQVESEIDSLKDMIKEAAEEQEQDGQEIGSGIVRFDNLEAFLSLAREEAASNVQGDIYRMNNRYFFVFKDTAPVAEDEVDYLYGRMLEFGEAHPTTESILIEYGQLLRSGDAIAFFGKQF